MTSLTNRWLLSFLIIVETFCGELVDIARGAYTNELGTLTDDRQISIQGTVSGSCTKMA